MYKKETITIFLSHSHKDIEKVRKIRDILETLNCEPITFFLKCLDDDNEELEDFIKKEIEARNIFIYCKSQNAERSEWVQKELEHIKQFDEKRLYTIDLDEDFEYSLVKVLGEISKIIRKNTIIIWRGYSSKNFSIKLGAALEQQGFVVKFFDPIIECEKPWDTITTWEWPMLHDRYSTYIENMVDTLSDKGVFIPLLTTNLNDGGWNSFMSSKIIHTLKRKSGIYYFPLFVHDCNMENMPDTGLNVNIQNAEKEILRIVKKVLECVHEKI